MINISYDFHLHSCLSPCGDKEMTPANIAGMAFVNGLDAIALTDHNTVKNCSALKKAAENYGLVCLYGMELTTLEEVHTVCLFADGGAAEQWNDYVYSHLIKVKNEAKIFDEQVIMDHEDNILGYEENLLINATDISFDEVFEPVERLGGIAFPAHVDKSSYSLISNLGFVPPQSSFTVAEFKNLSLADDLLNKHPYFKNCKLLSNSDAHYLEQVNTPINFLEIEELSAHAIINALKKK
jgi:PHP family Zn ribbon phosphoesterase